MARNTRGFTLIEIAIVLVIIGLLLGGILKGQELINSAKVKSLANDFRTIPSYIYGYQDKYRGLPGDDAAATSHVCPAATPACTTNGDGNGVIDGAWNSFTATDESLLFWQHIRFANLAPGPTDMTDLAGFIPKNAVGGKLGITSQTPITFPVGFRGTYFICSDGILGKLARQLDRMMDDGQPRSGSVWIALTATPSLATDDDAIVDSESYVVCMGF